MQIVYIHVEKKNARGRMIHIFTNKRNSSTILTACPSREIIFLASYVPERPWWPIQSPNKGRKKKAKAKRRERSDKIKIIEIRFERWQIVQFRKAIRQGIP